MYRQQWQADQQKQIIAQMAGKNPNKSNDGKRKNCNRNHHNSNGGAVVLAMAILLVEDVEDVEEAAVVAVGEETIVRIYKMSNVSIVERKVTIPQTVPYRERITMKNQTWFPRRISKTCFNPQ
jgi:hypothetical protein